MNDKEAIERCNELIKESSCWIGITNQQAIQIVLNIIKKQEEDIEDYEKILDIYDERKYRRQYLKEERAKRPNLLYPDSDEIYQKYFEQKEEIETLKRDFEIVNHECSRLEQEDIRKDLMIKEMAEWLYEDDSIFGFGIFKEINTPEKIKEYFENKVKESK